MKIKRLICVFSVLLAMMLSFAASAAPLIPPEDMGGDTGTVSPQAEETQWVYRVYEGRLQMRLWSYTRGIWLTDWIDC